MKIIRADHLGMCFGVRDAIDLAFRKAAEGPLTILGELVHNEFVMESLRQRGVTVETKVESVRTERAMITAHGASDRALRRAEARGLEVVQATCPLVHYAHRAVKRLVEGGYHPVIVGKREHVEVRGLTEDLDTFDVVLTDEDVERLRERPRFGVAAQTTQPIERVRRVVSRIRQRFPQSEVRFIDSVCQPTKQRQTAALELAKKCDLVVVIGGANSNNTQELVASCQRHCPRVYHVQTASGLREAWFQGVETVGITAGTSTPDNTIDAVEAWLMNLSSKKATASSAIEPVCHGHE